MVRPLELELKTYERERGCLENEHPGRFVLIRGEEIAAIFDDFKTASEHAALWCKKESYLIHRVGSKMSGALMLLAGWAAVDPHAGECQ